MNDRGLTSFRSFQQNRVKKCEISFGIPGQHITRKDQVEAALDTMLSSQGAYLLHVSIDELENVWPLVPPGASNAEMLEKLS